MSELIHCMSDAGQWTDSPRGLFCERPIRVGLGIGGWRLGVGGAGELWVGGVGAWGWGLGAGGWELGAWGLAVVSSTEERALYTVVTTSTQEAAVSQQLWLGKCY